MPTLGFAAAALFYPFHEMDTRFIGIMITPSIVIAIFIANLTNDDCASKHELEDACPSSTANGNNERIVWIVIHQPLAEPQIFRNVSHDFIALNSDSSCSSS